MFDGLMRLTFMLFVRFEHSRITRTFDNFREKTLDGYFDKARNQLWIKSQAIRWVK